VQAVREWAVYVAHKLLVSVLVYVGGGDTRPTVVSLFCPSALFRHLEKQRLCRKIHHLPHLMMELDT